MPPSLCPCNDALEFMLCRRTIFAYVSPPTRYWRQRDTIRPGSFVIVARRIQCIERFPRRAIACLTILVVVLSASYASAQVGGTGPAGVSAGKGTRFAGSMVSYRNILGAVGTQKSADPTWNPYYAMALLMAPRVRLTNRLSLSGMIIATRELTDSDWTTERAETTLSDTFLTFNFRLTKLGPVGLSASAQLRLPTSKASQARTMIGAGLVGLTAAGGGSFSLGGWNNRFSLALIGRFGAFMHQYTTASLESPWLEGCAELAGGCSRFSHSGVRNPMTRTQGIGALTWIPLPKLSISAQFGVFYDTLYDLGSTESQAGLSIQADATDPDARAIVFYILSANFVVTKSLSIAAGSETAHLQLAPDSSHYTPFFNRNTTLFVAFRIFPDALIAQLRGG